MSSILTDYRRSLLTLTKADHEEIFPLDLEVKINMAVFQEAVERNTIIHSFSFYNIVDEVSTTNEKGDSITMFKDKKNVDENEENEENDEHCFCLDCLNCLKQVKRRVAFKNLDEILTAFTNLQKARLDLYSFTEQTNMKYFTFFGKLELEEVRFLHHEAQGFQTEIDRLTTDEEKRKFIKGLVFDSKYHRLQLQNIVTEKMKNLVAQLTSGLPPNEWKCYNGPSDCACRKRGCIRATGCIVTNGNATTLKGEDDVDHVPWTPAFWEFLYENVQYL